jgi:flavin reductase ActVB
MTALLTQDQAFRDAMASFPSGVTIVTTTDKNGRWWGFTATSFCSVSMDPPLALVCLANSAECYPVFAEAEHWRIHFVRSEHADLAIKFATRGADKFADTGFHDDPHGLPYLDEACVTLRCTLFARHPGGDHTVLVGRVEEAVLDHDVTPSVYFRRSFRELAS